MKRFRFRLDRVQRVREIERERAEAEWARARAEKAGVEQRVLDLRASAAAEASGLAVGKVQAPADIRAAAFRAGLRARAVEMAMVDLAAAEQAAAVTGQALQDASRKVDALDRLQLRHREAWTVDARREEAATMDDVASTRAARDREERS